LKGFFLILYYNVVGCIIRVVMKVTWCW